MSNVSFGDPVLLDDGVSFDLKWWDRFGKIRYTNIFVVRDEQSGVIYVSRIDQGSEEANTKPEVEEMRNLLRTDPLLVTAIAAKLRLLRHPVAEQSLREYR